MTLAAALDLGISHSTWQRANRDGRLLPVHRGVSRMPGSEETRAGAILAAVLAVDGSIASHRSSAWLWDAQRPDDDPIDLIIPERSRHAQLDGVMLHRPRDLADLRPVHRLGVPTTSPLRMLLDLGAVDEPSVYPTMISLLATHRVATRAIATTLVSHARQGRHGVQALRSAVERYALDDVPPDSVLEVRMARLLVDHGLPPAQFHARLAGYEVDFFIVGTRVIIECDGWATHGLDRNQFEFDRLRNAELAAAGYLIVHVTWAQIRDDPGGLADRLRGVISRWHPELVLRQPRRTGRRSGAS